MAFQQFKIIFKSFVIKNKKKYGKAKIITATNVFAHMEDCNFIKIN